MEKPTTVLAGKRSPDLLVVDDEAGILHALCRALDPLEIDVVACVDPGEAMELVGAHPKVLVTDLHMPGCDGLSLLRRAREVSPGTIRFLLSGRADREHLIDAVNTGEVHRVLSKPWDNRMLRDAVRAAIASFEDARRREQEALSLAEERAGMAAALRAAKLIQRRFMPPRGVTVPGGEIACRFVACEHTSGDYLDIVPLGSATAIAIGDVTGHGLGATMHALSARALIRAGLGFGSDLASVFALANRHLHDDMEGGTFLTLFAAQFDPAARELVYVNAGHAPPLLAGPGGVRRLQGANIPLGILRDEVFRDHRVTIGESDVLLLYTDGAIEVRSETGDRLGMARLETMLADVVGRSPGRVLDCIWRAIHEFGDIGDDDVTLCALRPYP